MTAPDWRVAPRRTSVLLVEPSAEGREALLAQLEAVGGVEVRQAATAKAALTVAGAARPALILLPPEVDGEGGHVLCARLRADPGNAAAVLAIRVPATDAPVAVGALDRGADVLLPEPVTATLLQSAVAMARRVSRLHGSVDRRAGEAVHLLTTVLEGGSPAAAERAERVAQLSLRLAAALDVPERFRDDLDLAARLREIGALVAAADRAVGEDGGPWRTAAISAGILRQADRFRGAANLIAAMYENWDGSGVPNHLDHGQIPLRARILRVASDYADQLERVPGRDPGQACAALAARAGTAYDPVVVLELEAVVQRQRADGRRRIGLEALAPGMVLARDLFTSSGAKLLASGAVVSSHLIETLHRRHASDPIVGGLWVEG